MSVARVGPKGRIGDCDQLVLRAKDVSVRAYVRGGVRYLVVEAAFNSSFFCCCLRDRHETSCCSSATSARLTMRISLAHFACVSVGA